MSHGEWNDQRQWRWDGYTELAYVYALVDPFSGSLRYVGKTKNPASRLSGHISAARHGALTPVATWVRQILRDGKRPLILALAVTAKGALALQRETTEIERLASEGCQLVNVQKTSSGGEESVTYRRRPPFNGWPAWEKPNRNGGHTFHRR